MHCGLNGDSGFGNPEGYYLCNGQDTPGKWVSHSKGRMEKDGTELHHATPKSEKLKTSELFISEIFYLIFLNHG